MVEAYVPEPGLAKPHLVEVLEVIGEPVSDTAAAAAGVATMV
jgi:hypothetical protein